MDTSPLYIHFTSQADAEAIITTRRLYASSIVSGVYACEEGGKRVDGVQRTKIGRTVDRNRAVIFRTGIRPDIRYVEEVIWHAPAIELTEPRLVDASTAARLLDGSKAADDNGVLLPTDDPRPTALEVRSDTDIQAKLLERASRAHTERNTGKGWHDDAGGLAVPLDDPLAIARALIRIHRTGNTDFITGMIAGNRSLQAELCLIETPEARLAHDELEAGSRLLGRLLPQTAARQGNLPMLSAAGISFINSHGRTLVARDPGKNKSQSFIKD